jgi:hypothetical protein
MYAKSGAASQGPSGGTPFLRSMRVHPERAARDAAQLLGDYMELPQGGVGQLRGCHLEQGPLANGWAVALRGDRE